MFSSRKFSRDTSLVECGAGDVERSPGRVPDTTDPDNASGRPMVLLVDGDAELRDRGRDHLEMAGFVVHTAGIEERRDAALVAGVIALAHRAQLRVVAGGVETEAQLSFLQGENCNEVQGFLFAKPLTAPEVRRLIHGGVARYQIPEPKKILKIG